MTEEYKNKVKERFDELAQSYSNSALGFIRDKRLNLIKKHIKKNDKILEIGCGSGNLLRFIECDNIYGLDISSNMVKEAKKSVPNGNFIAGDAENLPYENNLFDKVIISEVLYYLPDMEKAISEAKRVLKKDGVILITTLNKKYNFVKTLVNLFKIGVHDNISMSYVSFKKLRNLLEKDFKIEEIRAIPIKYIPARFSLIFFMSARK
ncbi:methyltransferase domain-containing protein [Candidatus Woesearchaeota archaeon]|nr:methyltransferase domain-containing protein [Candidatus Woesearchaeota archaeon]